MNDSGALSAAAAALRRGAVSEAEGLCRAVLRDRPRDCDALTMLADVLDRQGRESEAIAAYERACAINPSGHLFSTVSMRRFRNAFGPPQPPRPPAAPGAARIQMRQLGTHGRFGNQLLQYAFGRLYAAEHGLGAEFPDWIGRDLYDLDDPLPSDILPAADEKTDDLFGSLNRHTGTVFANRNISGFFCTNTARWGRRAEAFRALFTLGRKLRAPLGQAMETLRSAGNDIVAIHLRSGDFGYGRFWVAPAAWYLDWLKTIWPRLERPVLYIASDDPEAALAFRDFAPWDAARLGLAIPGAEFIVDHHVLVGADHLAIANSSFSVTAAMLNAKARTKVRPHPNRRQLVPFDPWASEVLWDAVAEPALVPPEERALIERYLRNEDTVIHIGAYCSAWTNFARQAKPKLRVVEAEDAASAERVRETRDIETVRLLVVDDTARVRDAIERAAQSVAQGRLDAVLFRTAGSAPELLRPLTEAGFDVFRLGENSLKRLQEDAQTRGSYLALRSGVPPPFPHTG